MERLKALSEITQPDARNLAFVRFDASAPDGLRPMTLEDIHAAAAALELDTGAPEGIASAFAVARNIWLYGWFVWPFYTIASFEAYRCIEMALRVRCRNEGLLKNPARPPSLKALMQIAINQGWLADADIEHHRRLEERRQDYSDLMAESGVQQTPRAPDEYVRLLATTMPNLRNAHAHADALSFGIHSWALLSLELARDIINKLFSTTR